MGCSKSKSIEEIEKIEKIEEINNNKSEPNELMKSMDNKTQTNYNKTSMDKSNSGNALLFSYNKDNLYDKTIFKKTKLKKKLKTQKKEPFTITTIENDSFNINIIKINANSFLREYLIPIWFEKNIYIKFITQGKWRIDKNYDFTDSAGMPSTHTLKFNYGAVLGRVGSGKTFLLSPNELTYYTEKEGPLYLRMNLPKNIKVNPEGTMEIKVFDGKLMSTEEINEKIGWKEENMRYENKNSNELENDLTVDINNLRMNPILYYEKNIKNNYNNIWTEEFLNKMKYNNDNNGIQPLYINNNCYALLHNYVQINYEYIKNKIKRTSNKFLRDLQEKISVYIRNELICDNIINCRITKKNKTADICTQYLFDKNFRKFIFNKEYNSIAIKVIDAFFDDDYFIILAFMKD